MLIFNYINDYISSFFLSIIMVLFCGAKAIAPAGRQTGLKNKRRKNTRHQSSVAWDRDAYRKCRQKDSCIFEYGNQPFVLVDW